MILMTLLSRIKRSLLIIPPYLYGIFFILIPLFVVLKISLSKTTNTLPPYGSMLEIGSDYVISIKIYIKHYIDLLTNDFYLYVALSSLKIALLSTFFAFLVGYSIAYGLAMSSQQYRLFLLILVMLPFFISFLMRVYAWITLLSTYGIINNFLLYVGLIGAPIHFLDSTFAVCIGTVYCYLPFMILPVYTALEKIDPSYIEAAQDLGAKPFYTFYKIILPLSYSGIVTGCTLVFIPVMGEFVIPELLGGSEVLTLGRAIFWEFFANHNWPMTCAMGILTIIILVLPIVFLQREKNV